MNTYKNKILLATRDRGASNAVIVSTSAASTNEIYETLSKWLMANFNISACYRKTSNIDDSGTMYSYFIKTLCGKKDVCVYKRQAPGNSVPNSSETCDIQDIPDSELVYLIYGLTLHGYLSDSANEGPITQYVKNDEPMIILAWLEPSLRDQGALSISHFATNDPALVKVGHTEGLGNSAFTSGGKEIVFNGRYPFDVSLMPITDKNLINSSLLLSYEFMHAFNACSMKVIEFSCKRSGQIEEGSHVGRNGDLQAFSASALLQNSNAASVFYWRALSNHLFNNNAKVTLLANKKRGEKLSSRLIASIDDNNQARQTLSISLHKHEDPVANDYFTLCWSKESNDRRFLSQTYHIHTSGDIAEIINEMAKVLKDHNNLYKSEAALTSLISGAFDECNSLAA